MRRVIPLLLCLSLAACTDRSGEDPVDFSSPEVRQGLASEYIAYLKAQRPLPPITDPSVIAEYADVFGTVCLESLDDPSRMVPAVTLAGFAQLPNKPRYRPSTDRFIPLEDAQSLPYWTEYRDLILAMQRDDGTVPFFRRWAGGTQKTPPPMIFTDGSAIMEIGGSDEDSLFCALGLNVAEEALLLAEMQRVVTSAGLAEGPPPKRGAFGIGYKPYPRLDLFIALGRERRDIGSPVFLRLMGERRKP